MQSVEPRITEDAFGVLGVERSVKSRTSYGGTAPANVRRQAKALAEAARRRVNAKRSAASFACFSLLTGRKGRKARPSTRTSWRKNRVFTMAAETIRIRGQAK